MFILQTIIFNKKYWDKNEIINFLSNNHFKYDLDEKDNTFRARQTDPDENMSYMTKTKYINDRPIEFVYMY